MISIDNTFSRCIGAMRDLALTRADVAVYAWAHCWLDVVQYRRAKSWFIASRTGLSPSAAARALAHLVTRGYIEVQHVDTGRAYRLFHSVNVPAKAYHLAEEQSPVQPTERT